MKRLGFSPLLSFFTVLLMFVFGLSNASPRTQTVPLFSTVPSVTTPAHATSVLGAPLPLPGPPQYAVRGGDYAFVITGLGNLGGQLSCLQVAMGGVPVAPVLLNSVGIGEFTHWNLTYDSATNHVLVHPDTGLSARRYSADAALILDDGFPVLANAGAYAPSTQVLTAAGTTLSLSQELRLVTAVNLALGVHNSEYVPMAIPSGLAVSGPVVLATDIVGTVHVLDGTTGELLNRQFAPGGGIKEVVALGNGRALVFNVGLQAVHTLDVTYFPAVAVAAPSSTLSAAGYMQLLKSQPVPIQVGCIRLMANSVDNLSTTVTIVKTNLGGASSSRQVLAGTLMQSGQSQPIVQFCPRGLFIDQQTEIHFTLPPSASLIASLQPVNNDVWKA